MCTCGIRAAQGNARLLSGSLRPAATFFHVKVDSRAAGLLYDISTLSLPVGRREFGMVIMSPVMSLPRSPHSPCICLFACLFIICRDMCQLLLLNPTVSMLGSLGKHCVPFFGSGTGAFFLLAFHPPTCRERRFSGYWSQEARKDGCGLRVWARCTCRALRRLQREREKELTTSRFSRWVPWP